MPVTERVRLNPPKPPSKVRTIIRTIRVSPSEDLKLRDRAKAADKPLSTYLRERALA